MTTLDPHPPSVTAATRPGASGPGLRRTVGAYVALTKPRIIELLLVTTVPTMILAAQGLPDLALVAATLVGGSLAAGSANALNCYFDRDIDRVMHRTSRRPLVTGEVSPRGSVIFAVVLGVVSVALLAATVNVLAAALALTAILFYVVVYTLLLKRRTPQNIVWGGAAGLHAGADRLVRSHRGLSLAARSCCSAWSSSGRRRTTGRCRCATARTTPLPGCRCCRSWPRRCRWHSRWCATRGRWWHGRCCWCRPPVSSTPSWPCSPAAPSCWRDIGCSGRARRHESALAPMRMFHLSITYLTLLFVAIAVDPFVPLRLF